MTEPRFAVRISRGLVTHWNNEPLMTWEQADECRQRIAELQHEDGEVEQVLLSVPTEATLVNRVDE